MSASWTFVSAHGAVLLAVHRDPEATMEDIAEVAGISVRWAIKVVGDLMNEGYLRRERRGRRYRYLVDPDRPMRHPVTRDVDIDRLLYLLEPPEETRTAQEARRNRKAELTELADRVATERERLAVLERHRRHLEDVLRQVTSTLRREARDV